jgi:Flp pilus assembly protein TadG
MKRMKLNVRKDRRGVIAVLSAVLLVLMLSMVAFAVDIGYIGLSKTQLQVAADSTALAAASTINQGDTAMVTAARSIAEANRVAGRNIQLNASDVEMGLWDANARTFTSSPSAINAVRVTVRTAANSGGSTPLFFGRIFGKDSLDQSASAIATVNPRDISFVMDMSGSMNYDTDPAQSRSTSALIGKIFEDFGFGAYTTTSQYAGESLGITSSTGWVKTLTKSGGKLRGSTIAARYKVTSADDASSSDTTTVTPVKEWKAYAYVMEVQLPAATLMPAAYPAPYAGASYNDCSTTYPSANNNYAWPTTNYYYWKTFIDSYRSSIGYLSYVKFLMDHGRDETVDGASYTPLSIHSNLCPYKTCVESVGGTSFTFPAREMPTHSARRALIAALQTIKSRNLMVDDPTYRDRVSIVTFDKTGSEVVLQPLTSDYDTAMQACTKFQAVGHNSLSTTTEAGMKVAFDHIKPASESGVGREHANKIVTLVTDGVANLKRPAVTTTMIDAEKNGYPSKWTNPTTGAVTDNWAGLSGDYVYERKAAMMWTAQMQRKGWSVFAEGVGSVCDYDFMDRIARMGATANTSGQSFRGASDPALYESNMKDIFDKIITSPKLRLVQ